VSNFLPDVPSYTATLLVITKSGAQPNLIFANGFE